MEKKETYIINTHATWWKTKAMRAIEELEEYKKQVEEQNKKKETHIINRDVRWWKDKAMQNGRELDKLKRELAQYKNHVEKQDKKIKKLKKKLK